MEFVLSYDFLPVLLLLLLLCLLGCLFACSLLFYLGPLLLSSQNYCLERMKRPDEKKQSICCEEIFQIELGWLFPNVKKRNSLCPVRHSRKKTIKMNGELENKQTSRIGRKLKFWVENLNLNFAPF